MSYNSYRFIGGFGAPATTTAFGAPTAAPSFGGGNNLFGSPAVGASSGFSFGGEWFWSFDWQRFLKEKIY